MAKHFTVASLSAAVASAADSSTSSPAIYPLLASYTAAPSEDPATSPATADVWPPVQLQLLLAALIPPHEQQHQQLFPLRPVPVAVGAVCGDLVAVESVFAYLVCSGPDAAVAPAVAGCAVPTTPVFSHHYAPAVSLIHSSTKSPQHSIAPELIRLVSEVKTATVIAAEAAAYML